MSMMKKQGINAKWFPMDLETDEGETVQGYGFGTDNFLYTYVRFYPESKEYELNNEDPDGDPIIEGAPESMFYKFNSFEDMQKTLTTLLIGAYTEKVTAKIKELIYQYEDFTGQPYLLI